MLYVLFIFNIETLNTTLLYKMSRVRNGMYFDQTESPLKTVQKTVV